MDREVEGFITGHRPKDSNAGNDYGDRWIRTMSAEIEKYPLQDRRANQASGAAQAASPKQRRGRCGEGGEGEAQGRARKASARLKMAITEREGFRTSSKNSSKTP
jgi:hypothetical protein